MCLRTYSHVIVRGVAKELPCGLRNRDGFRSGLEVSLQLMYVGQEEHCQGDSVWFVETILVTYVCELSKQILSLFEISDLRDLWGLLASDPGLGRSRHVFVHARYCCGCEVAVRQKSFSARPVSRVIYGKWADIAQGKQARRTVSSKSTWTTFWERR